MNDPNVGRILIVYNTKTGNTESMARGVEQGARSVAGVEVSLKYHATTKELEEADAVIIGAPTYNHSVTIDIRSLLEKAAENDVVLKGKMAAAFGSYGWSGEAPKQVLEILRNKFQMNIIEPPILAKYKPDEKALKACAELGRKIAEKLL